MVQTSNPFASGAAQIDPQAEEARRQLLTRIPKDLRIDVDSCFPEVTGFRVAKMNDLRLGYLIHVEGLLRAVLRPDETIRYVCLGREQVWWEMFGAGQWAALLNCNVLIVTETRIVMIHADSKGRPTRYLNELPVSAIKRVKGFLARTSISTGKGTRHFNLSLGDRKQMIRVLPEKNETASGGASHLCPACFMAHEQHSERCSGCATQFKSPKTAAIRSLIMPGLGSWYAGSRGLAALQMFRGLFLWLVFLIMVAGAASGKDADAAIAFVIFLPVLGLVHITDALFSRAMAKKGLIALDLSLPARRGAADR